VRFVTPCSERSSKFFSPGARVSRTTHLRKDREGFSQSVSNTFAIELSVRKYRLEEAPLFDCGSLSHCNASTALRL
jgi:hypothetical protein